MKLQGVAVLIISSLWVHAASAGPTVFTTSDVTSCADQALQTFITHFWDASESEFREGYNAGNCDYSPADYWLSAEALHAMVDSYARTRRPDVLQIINQYYDGRKGKWLEFMPWGYYDDEEWMALALIHATEVIGDNKYLQTAVTIQQAIQGGWDTKCCGSTPGGIWWDGKHDEKSTVSNSVDVIVAAKIGKMTQDPQAIAFAEQVYKYWMSAMAFTPFNNPSFLQVGDHLLPNGTRVLGLLTYDEGMMAGAAVALYQSTNDSHYLEDAKKFFHYMVDQETTPTPYGRILTDHALTDVPNCRPNFLDPSILPRHKDFPLFKYTALRSLLELQKSLPVSDPDKKTIQNFAMVNAQAACEIARDPQSGLFSTNWEKRDPQNVSSSLISPITAALGTLTLLAQ